MALPRKGELSSAQKAAQNFRSKAYMVVDGGHSGSFWPEELIVVTDVQHFLHDHADVGRTDRDDPDMRKLVAFCREKGVPGRPIVWQTLRADGGVDTYVVDGRRRRQARIIINEELKAAGLTPERIDVTIRNDLNPTQLRELVAQSNEGAKLASLAQRIGQARALVDEYRRQYKAENPLGTPDEMALCARAAGHFRGTTGRMILRWTKVGRLAVEAQAFILHEKAPIEVVDELSSLAPEHQSAAIEAAARAKNPKAAKAGIQAFIKGLREQEPARDAGREAPEARETTRRWATRSRQQWMKLEEAFEAYAKTSDADPTIRGVTELLRWARSEIDLPELLKHLGLPALPEAPRPEPVPVQVKTREERATYDAAVLAALQANPEPQAMAAQEIAARAGGTPGQVRAALRRLVEANCVAWSGQAAGTRYIAVEGAVYLPAQPFSRASSSPRTAPFDLRVSAGRAAYDAAIFAAIKRCGTRGTAADVRAAVGGSAEQARAALARLVASGSLLCEDGSYQAVGDSPASPRKALPVDARLVDYFKNVAADHRVTKGKLAEQLGLEPNEVAASLRRLVGDGLVTRGSLGRGAWYGPAHGPGGDGSDKLSIELFDSDRVMKPFPPERLGGTR